MLKDHACVHRCILEFPMTQGALVALNMYRIPYASSPSASATTQLLQDHGVRDDTNNMPFRPRAPQIQAHRDIARWPRGWISLRVGLSCEPDNVRPSLLLHDCFSVQLPIDPDAPEEILRACRISLFAKPSLLCDLMTEIEVT